MAVELILAPEAEQDISEAYDWYEQRRPGLGEESSVASMRASNASAARPNFPPKFMRSIGGPWCGGFPM